ncbi:MAG: hypothetical protein PHX70_14405 [Clostridium sp.]|nr:hypothetical protein [Clostridium sp.]
MTIEELNKINEKCGNDFKLDLQYYMFHKEKQLEKLVNINDNQFLEYTLYFSENYRSYNKEIVIKLRISKYTKQGDYATSQGLGQTFIIEEGLTRKNFNKLVELSHTLDITQFNIDNEKLENPFLI